MSFVTVCYQGLIAEPPQALKSPPCTKMQDNSSLLFDPEKVTTGSRVSPAGMKEGTVGMLWSEKNIGKALAGAAGFGLLPSLVRLS